MLTANSLPTGWPAALKRRTKIPCPAPSGACQAITKPPPGNAATAGRAAAPIGVTLTAISGLRGTAVGSRRRATIADVPLSQATTYPPSPSTAIAGSV